MAETKINKNQAGDGIFTSDNLVAGTNISMTEETETIVSGLDEYTQLYIPFNDSLSDLSANNCPVTLAGNPTPTYMTGKFDKALSSITASSGYVPVKWTKSDSSKFSIADGFTFEYWQYVDTDVYGGPYQLWFGDDGGSIQFKSYFYVNYGDPVLSIKVGAPTAEVSGSDISSSFVDKSWNHIAMTFSPSNYSRVFLNGHKVYEFTGSSWTSLSNLGSSYDGIQVNSDGTSFSSGLSGKYDDLRLSNTIRYTGDFTPPTSPFGAVTQIDVTKINNTQDISSKANASLDNLTAAGKDIGAELSFPATNSYTNLVLGASGATYTAAYNGYLAFEVSSTNSSVAYVTVAQGNMLYQQVWFANGVVSLYPGGAIPITKGTFQINYGGIAGMTFLRLFYNQGNKPS